MFSNPGKRIKKAALYYFWFITIASVVFAFVLGIEKEYVPSHYVSSTYIYGYTTTHFNPAVFFVLLFGGPIIAYISSLFLYGFGEMVENSAKTENEKLSDESEKKNDIAKKEYKREAELARKEIAKHR